MSTFEYKRWLTVTATVVLVIGFSTSIAIADDGVAMLSDSVLPVGHVEVTSEPPPSPFADPTPDASAVEPDTSETAPDATMEVCCNGCGDETCCSESSCGKTYVFGLNFGNVLHRRSCLKKAWVRADYLLWWTKGGYVPPLVTTSSYGSTGSGELDSPYTSVLFGNEIVDYTNRSGLKISTGFDLGCGRAIEFDYLDLGRGYRGVDLSSDGSFAQSGAYSAGNPYLARPLVDNETGDDTSEEVAGDYFRGRIRAGQSEYFQSYGILYHKTLCCPTTGCCDECCDEYCDETCDGCGGGSHLATRCGGLLRMVKPSAWKVDFLCGWRNYRLEEWTTVHESLVVEQSPPGTTYVQGSTFDISDAFETENVFNGAEIGLTAKRCYGRWSLDLLAKVGLGSQSQMAQIHGGTIINDTIETVTYNDGLLALASNSGRYSRNRFVAIPQFGGEISYQLTKYLRAHVGYNVIYWPNVVRSGSLIDLNVDLDQIPPSEDPGTRPAFTWNDSDYWAQGLNFGLEANY